MSFKSIITFILLGTSSLSLSANLISVKPGKKHTVEAITNHAVFIISWIIAGKWMCRGSYSPFLMNCPLLSAAVERNYDAYLSLRPEQNELYTQFKYTELKGFDYNEGDGTITRRDPSKVIFENGKYYVWYTHRETPVKPVGMARAKEANDTIPSADCDLSLDIDDQQMKGHYYKYEPEFYYEHSLSQEQKRRIQNENKKLMEGI